MDLIVVDGESSEPTLPSPTARASAASRAARVGSVQNGQSVDVLQRTTTGTPRAQATLGWATATIRDGKELLAGPGCESKPQAEINTEEQLRARLSAMVPSDVRRECLEKGVSQLGTKDKMIDQLVEKDGTGTES